MLTPEKRSLRLDQIDAERFEDMVGSEPFGLYRFRLLAELDRARNDCEQQDGDTAIHRAQGRAAALRVALDLPAVILKEVRAKATS